MPDAPPLNQAKRRSGGPRGTRGGPRAPLGMRSILISLQQGAMHSGLPVTTLRDLVLNGHLPAVRFPGKDGDSRRIWLRRADIEELITRRTERGPA